MKIPIVRLNMLKDKEIEFAGRRMSAPDAAVECIRPLIDGADREYVIACGVDSKHQPVYIEQVAIGTVSSCTVSAPEIFKAALLSNAAGLFLFHNHPSGEPEPSQEDKDVTTRIRLSGELIGICLIDHIIIGDDGSYFSFRENKLLKRSRRSHKKIQKERGKDNGNDAGEIQNDGQLDGGRL